MSWITDIFSSGGGRGGKRRPPVITETGPLEDAIAPDSLIRSKCLTRLACVAIDDFGRMAVSVNGRRGPFHEGIIAGFPVFDASGAHMVYAAVDGGRYTVSYDWKEFGPFEGLLKKTPVMSADGAKAIFVAGNGGRESVFCLEKELFALEDGWSAVEGTPCLSCGGRKTALAAERGGLKRAFIDDRPDEGIYSYIESYGFFSPDGASYAYMAVKPSGERVVVQDGRELPYVSCAMPAFAGNYEAGEGFGVGIGARAKKHPLAFFVKSPGRHFIVFDGTEGKKYNQIATYTPIFSPDRTRAAFVVEDADGKCFAVAGSDEFPKFDDIYSPTLAFSPDGKNLIFRACQGAGELVSVNGGRGPVCAAITEDPFFSPDGSHYAYTASDGDSVFAVIDGVAQAPYAGVGKPVFSADGGRWAYVADPGTGAYTVVANGKETGMHANIYNEPVFSPDGGRLLYCVNDGKADRIVVDGEPGRPFESIVNFGGTLKFTAPDTFVYMAVESGKIFMVEEKL